MSSCWKCDDDDF